MMDLAQTKRRRRQYVLLGMVLLFAGVVGSVMGLLKHLYVMKVAQGPIAKLVTALWDVPGSKRSYRSSENELEMQDWRP